LQEKTAKQIVVMQTYYETRYLNKDNENTAQTKNSPTFQDQPILHIAAFPATYAK